MIDIQKIWDEILDKLSSRLNAVTLSLWVNELSPYSVKDKYLILLAPTDHAKKTIMSSYYNEINDSAKELVSALSGVKIITQSETYDYSVSDATLNDELVV